MGDFGNSVTGGIVGNTYIEFSDGTRIVYELPPITIAGLIMGKRLIHFTGGISFIDQKSEYKCVLKLNKEGTMFSKQQGPLDEFKGSILDSTGRSLGEINGSWMDRLEIDGEEVWKLE